MKLLGCALLVLGFAVMNWKILQARDITLAVASEQLQRMPQQVSCTSDDVRLALKRVARDTWDRATSWFYFSGVAMLAGGLLAAFSPKRQGRKPHTAQPTASPNGGPAMPLSNSGAAEGPPSVS